MKRCSTSLLVRETQIKTTLRYLLTPVRVAKMNKPGDYRCWKGCGETRIFLHCWWECKRVQPLWRTVWRFLKKLKIELPYNSAIAVLGIYLKDTKIQIERGTHTLMFIAALSKTNYEKSPNVHQLMNRQRRCGLYIQWNIIQPSKRMKFHHLQ